MLLEFAIMNQNTKKSLFSLIPLVIFLGVGIFLWRGLNLDPTKVPSVLINKPTPNFSLSTVKDPNKQLTNQLFKGHVSLLNVWATWCVSCRVEHPVLMEIKKLDKVKIYGLDYKDKRPLASKWLEKRGNPYVKSLFDPTGRAAIDWGVYGTPETFIIDKKGFIRYKFIGPMTMQDWQETVYPIVKRLEGKS